MGGDRWVLPWLLTVTLVLLAGLVLLWMGRDAICPCGTVKLWHGEVPSTEGSQHLTDWWTFSHVIHGFAFYAAIRWTVPGIGFGWMVFAATLAEVLWEILENSDWVIDRYRTVTVAFDYNGDSVLNTGSDVVAMWLGFLLAARLPVPLSLVIVIAVEAIPMIAIRDGLLLNILMLLWPLEAVLDWQRRA